MQAENNYNRSIRCAERSDPINVTGVLVNLATAQEEQGQTEKAEMTYKKAITSWKEPTSTTHNNHAVAHAHIARAWFNLARYHINQGFLSLALKDCEKAYHYDCKSNHLMDLCRTIQLYVSLLMEVVVRDVEASVDVHVQARLNEFLVCLQEKSAGGSLHEIKEITKTTDTIQNQLDQLQQWKNQAVKWNSKSYPELCDLCIKLSDSEPMMYDLLQKVVSFLLSSLPSQPVNLTHNTKVIQVSPEELKQWLQFLQVEASANACDFAKVFSLLQQTPELLSYQSILPCETPSIVFSRLKETLQIRSRYPTSQSGIEGLDSPLSSSASTRYLQLLRTLLPALPEPHSTKVHHYLPSQGIHKQTNHSYGEEGQLYLSHSNYPRKRTHHSLNQPSKRVARILISQDSEPYLNTIPDPDPDPDSVPVPVPVATQAPVHDVVSVSIPEPSSHHIHTKFTNITVHFHVILQGEEVSFTDSLPQSFQSSLEELQSQIHQFVSSSYVCLRVGLSRRVSAVNCFVFS